MKRKMTIRLSSLKKAIKAAGKALQLSPREVEAVLHSARVGSEAEYHTGSAGVLAYYAIEGTVLATAYFESPQLWHQFYQEVDTSLNSGRPYEKVFSEPKNHVELSVYSLY